MRFIVFTIIVFGVFLLVISRDNEDLQAHLKDRVLAEVVEVSQAVADAGGAAESGDATDNAGSATNAHSEDPTDTADLAAMDVLTRGTEFTREQLERHDPDAGAARDQRDSARDARQLRELHRETLTTLARIESMFDNQ